MSLMRIPFLAGTFCAVLWTVSNIAGAQNTSPANNAKVQTEEGVETLVVTARKREENLQDVPSAVSAFSGEQLEALAVTNLEDLTALAPNTKVNAGRATNSTINAYIRGVGQNDPLWGFEPGVGIYIDDVYIARPQGAMLDVYDVERIEILRGPQGTLYGKNTLAGAIKYVTRDIVGPSTFKASAAFGNYNQIDVKLGGSMALSDSVYVGAAVARLTRDGYGEVVATTTPYVFNSIGEDVSDKDVLAARANATFVMGERARLKFMADLVQDDSNARGGQRLNNVIQPALDNRYDVRNDMPVDQDEVEIKGGAAIYTLELNDQWDLKAIGAYREGEVTTFIDFETLNSNFFNVPAIYSDDQTSGELQLNYGAGRWQAVGGLFYFDGTACGSFNAVLGAANLVGLTQGCVDTQSVAVYFDSTYSLTSRLNLNIGARWNEDDKEAAVFVAQYLGNLPGNGSVFNPASLPAGITLLVVQSNYTNDRSFSDVSPRVGVDFHVTDETMLYATYSQGFKSGGFDMRGNAAVNPATVNGYEPETVDNYEIGIKTLLFDNRLRLSTTAFYADYKDVQITTQQFVLVGGNPTNATAVLNAGKQVNQGVEFEAAWRPVQAFTLTSAIGYLDAEIKEFLTANPANPSQIIDVSGINSPINAPEWTVSLDAMYQQDMFGGVGTARIGYQWRDDTKVANTTVSLTDQPSYDVLDVGVSFVPGVGKWRFAVDAKNVTDEKYRTAGYDFGSTGALGGLSQIGYYGAPRTYTFTASYQY